MPDYAHELSNLTDIDFTSPADGDLVAWNAGAGKFVNSGNLRIGGSIEVYNVALLDTIATTLSLDDAGGHAYTIFLSGLTLDGPKTGWIVPIAGRYLITGNGSVASDPVVPLWFKLISNKTNGEFAGFFIPASGTGFPASTNFTALVELAAGQVINFIAQVSGQDTTLSDSYWSVQYVGVATSL
jgi:hypothetical protein